MEALIGLTFLAAVTVPFVAWVKAARLRAQVAIERSRATQLAARHDSLAEAVRELRTARKRAQQP